MYWRMEQKSVPYVQNNVQENRKNENLNPDKFKMEIHKIKDNEKWVRQGSGLRAIGIYIHA